MKSKILLVEDEAVIALSSRKMLERNGYSVITVNTGEKAVETALADRGIDLILMDIHLGKGIDGTQAAERILRERDIPLIFLSSHTEREVVEKTEGISSCGYVVKNSGETVLLATIRTAFRLGESEERLRTAEAIAHIGHYDIDLTSGKALWSQETFRIFGLEPDGPVPDIETYILFVHEEDRDMVMGKFDRCVGGKESFDAVYRIIHSSGSVCYVHSMGRLRYDGDGVPLGMFGTIQDISELKRVENSFAESRNWLISIFKAAPTGIGVIQGKNRIIIEANEKVCQISGYSREELVGESARIFYPGSEEYNFVGSEKYRQIAEKGTGEVETRWKRKDGSIIDVLLASTPLYPGDVSRGVSFTVMDITGRKRNEERVQALAAERETLLREVQHRIKNTMNTMVAMLALQADSLEEGSAAAAALTEAGSRFRSMELLYEKLYRTESHAKLSTEEYLGELVRNIAELYPNRQKVDLFLDIEDFQLDAKSLSSLGMIVNELVTNAMKYAFGGDERGMLKMTVHRDGETVTMLLEDNGPGIPDFEGDSARRGFGLSMIDALTEQLDGTIRFERKQGTCVVLAFDCVQCSG